MPPRRPRPGLARRHPMAWLRWALFLHPRPGWAAGQEPGWSWGRRRLAGSRRAFLVRGEPAHGFLVAGLVAGQVPGPEPLPVAGVGGRRGVPGLERLVAAVVRHAAGEVRTTGCLHHADHHGPVD